MDPMMKLRSLIKKPSTKIKSKSKVEIPVNKRTILTFEMTHVDFKEMREKSKEKKKKNRYRQTVASTTTRATPKERRLHEASNIVVEARISHTHVVLHMC